MNTEITNNTEENDSLNSSFYSEEEEDEETFQSEDGTKIDKLFTSQEDENNIAGTPENKITCRLAWKFIIIFAVCLTLLKGVPFTIAEKIFTCASKDSIVSLIIISLLVSCILIGFDEYFGLL